MLRHVEQARHQHQGVTCERGAGTHEVDIEAQTSRRFVPAEHEFIIAEVGTLWLDAGDPRGFIIIDDGDRRLRRFWQRP